MTAARSDASPPRHLALAAALSWTLVPLLLLQGLWLRRRIPRLPEAAGPVTGVVAGPPPPVRLLLLGESPMAGVGIATHAEALSGQTAAALALQTGRAVHWQVVAANGATAATLPALLSRATLPDAADVAIIALGVNDVIALRSATQWQHDLSALIALLQERLPSLPVVLAAVPPLDRFPALPTPLRQFLGLRAALLNEATRSLAQALPRVAYAAMPEVGRADVEPLFCADRFHPSAEGCRHWASHLAATATLLLRAADPRSP